KCEGVPEVVVGVRGSWTPGERAMERADGLLGLLEFQICQAEVVVRIAACRVDGDGLLIRRDRFSVALLGGEVKAPDESVGVSDLDWVGIEREGGPILIPGLRLASPDLMNDAQRV